MKKTHCYYSWHYRIQYSLVFLPDMRHLKNGNISMAAWSKRWRKLRAKATGSPTIPCCTWMASQRAKKMAFLASLHSALSKTHWLRAAV